MKRVVYIDDHGTWKEPRASLWYNHEEESDLIKFLEYAREKPTSKNVRVQQIVDITEQYKEDSHD
jgi:hypothetical protein